MLGISHDLTVATGVRASGWDRGAWVCRVCARAHHCVAVVREFVLVLGAAVGLVCQRRMDRADLLRMPGRAQERVVGMRIARIQRGGVGCMVYVHQLGYKLHRPRRLLVLKPASLSCNISRTCGGVRAPEIPLCPALRLPPLSIQ